MSNTVKVKVLESGPRNFVLAVFLQSDGVTGELNAETLLDPVDLGLTRKTRFSIQNIDYNFAGFDATLEFDSGSIDPNFKWALVEGANNPVDFSPYGGILDDSGIDGTGKLQITTSGFTSTQDFGSILIKLIRKRDDQ